MRIRTRHVLGLLAGVLVVSGCAAPDPAPTPDPTETPAARSIPEPRLPLTCDELVSPATVAGFAGADVPVLREAVDVPQTWLDVVGRQFGAVSCVWAADRDQTSLSVLIAPDSADYFIGGGVGMAPGYYERYDVVGDRSVHSCPYGQCTFEIVVDGHLITGHAMRPDIMDEIVLEPMILSVLEEMVESVAAASAERRPAWTSPPDVLPTWGFGCENEAAIAELAALNGVSDPFTTGTDWESGSFTAMVRSVAPTWCTVVSESSPASFSLSLVEGGGWVFDVWSTDPPAQWDGGIYRALEVDGVGLVYLGDEGVDPVAFDAYFELDGSLVSFGREAATEEEFLSLLPGVADILLAAADR